MDLTIKRKKKPPQTENVAQAERSADIRGLIQAWLLLVVATEPTTRSLVTANSRDRLRDITDLINEALKDMDAKVISTLTKLADLEPTVKGLGERIQATLSSHGQDCAWEVMASDVRDYAHALERTTQAQRDAHKAKVEDLQQRILDRKRLTKLDIDADTAIGLVSSRVKQLTKVANYVERAKGPQKAQQWLEGQNVEMNDDKILDLDENGFMVEKNDEEDTDVKTEGKREKKEKKAKDTVLRVESKSSTTKPKAARSKPRKMTGHDHKTEESVKTEVKTDGKVLNQQSNGNNNNNSSASVPSVAKPTKSRVVDSKFKAKAKVPATSADGAKPDASKPKAKRKRDEDDQPADAKRRKTETGAGAGGKKKGKDKN